MLENILAGIIATLICSSIFKLLESIKNRKKDNPTSNSSKEMITLRELSIARKQFFLCLVYLLLIIVGLVFDIFIYDFLLAFVFVTVFFTFILLWGAFDAIFQPFKNSLQNLEGELSDENSDNN